MSGYNKGLPRRFPLSITANEINVILVTANANNLIIVGLQFMFEDNVVAAYKLFGPLKIALADVEIQCRQVSGHLANDGKQVNILTGQGTCRVRFPMACCRVSLNSLDNAPEWIQQQFLQEAAKAGSVTVSTKLHKDVDDGLPCLPNAVIDLIGDLAEMPVKSDPPKRVGE